MTANINPETGIAYGYISANALHPDIVEQLVYGETAINLDNLERWIELAHKVFNEQEPDDETLDADYIRLTNALERYRKLEMPDMGELSVVCKAAIAVLEEAGLDETDYIIDTEEPSIVGQFHSVLYMTSWLGGALNFFIFKNPYNITNNAQQSSLCVPNAGILDTLDGDVEAYDVPFGWRAEV